MTRAAWLCISSMYVACTRVFVGITGLNYSVVVESRTGPHRDSRCKPGEGSALCTISTAALLLTVVYTIFHILISYFVCGCCRTGLLVFGPLYPSVQFTSFFLLLLTQMYDHFVRCNSYSSNMNPKEKHQPVSQYVFLNVNIILLVKSDTLT